MEDRARTAAQASRAKTSDSDALRQNYVTPGLAGQPITTVDNSKTFNPNLSCQKSATLMEVLIQPSGTGDIGAIQIARDTDLDGTVDSRATLPVAVSGICANGIISCTPGTWTQCRYFRWDTDPARNLKLAEGQMSELAGCYCINNSCGTNLVWGNLPGVLGDLGGGMIGALTSADPRIGVAQAVIDGPVIRYVGAQTTACAADQALPQSAYRANPQALAGDATAASAGNHVFQLLASSPSGLGKAQQLRHCTIERQVNPFDMGLALDGDDKQSAITMAVAIVAEMANAATRKGVTTSEWNLLKSAVQWAIDTGRADRGIDAVREWLGTYPAATLADLDRVEHLVPVSRELAFNLRDFGSDGAYGHYFNGPSTLDIRSDEFVVLELERLKAMPDLFNVIVMVVVNAVTQELYLSARDRPRFVLCDEAAQFMMRQDGQDLSRLGVARLVVDPFSYWINTSAPGEVAAFDALVRQGLSPLEAVCRLAGVDPAEVLGGAAPRAPERVR